MIQLIKGECLEAMKGIPTGSIDAIITDPPYGTTACKWDSVIDFALMWEQLNRIIKPNGAIVLFGSEPFSSALRMSNVRNYKYDWTWEKEKGVGQLNCKRQPMRKVENILVFYKKQCTYNPQFTKGKPYKAISGKQSKYTKDSVYGKQREVVNINNGTRYPVNLIKFNRQAKQGREHPTQKPVALMEYLIKTYTNENETVLDFTMGSGSTGVAAKNLNRNFIGIELDNKYFEIAENRITND
jgi:site-specific DNA-methyltransferase (adenine-specific)